jgi:N-methylhydantoinase A/oxoprolinase/acetone carboxylase beta subunit
MARGIQQLVDENMAAAVRVHAAERGFDMRRYTLVATGGAGPVHACGVARRLGLKRVLVPPAAGVGSAFGLLLAPIAFDFARSYVSRLEQLDLTYLNDLLDGLEIQGREIVTAAGVKADEIDIRRAADMRYVGQGHEIRVAVVPDRLDEHAVPALQAAFEQAYLQLYGRLCAGVPIEVIHWRVTVSGPRPAWAQVQLDDRQPADPMSASVAQRRACFKSDIVPEETPVYNRYRLPPGFVTPGPAIIEEAESTTIVPPDWQVRVDSTGCLVLDDQV